MVLTFLEFPKQFKQNSLLKQDKNNGSFKIFIDNLLVIDYTNILKKIYDLLSIENKRIISNIYIFVTSCHIMVQNVSY